MKLLDKVCKYEMDPVSIVEDTKQTRFCPQMDRRTDNQGETPLTSLSEGYNDSILPTAKAMSQKQVYLNWIFVHIIMPVDGLALLDVRTLQTLWWPGLGLKYLQDLHLKS